MASDKQETLAGIVAEKRRKAKYLIESAEASARCGETMAGTPYTEENLEFARQDAKEMLAEADRLEAAWKRECGNSALMREALEDSQSLLKSFSWGEYGAQVREQMRDNRAALAKPARNCDRFGGDYKMLHTAWFDWTGSPSGQNPDGTAKMAFGEWLLASAIKKGGEA